MPAPTVVPATNAALPMTVPAASSGSAAASFGLENRCGRGGAVKGVAGFGTAVSQSQSIRLRIVRDSIHTSVARYGYSRWKRVGETQYRLKAHYSRTDELHALTQLLLSQLERSWHRRCRDPATTAIARRSNRLVCFA